jgi:hypothetical protein
MHSFPFLASLLFFLLNIIREINLDAKLLPKSIDACTMCTDYTSYELPINVELD